MSKQIDRTRLAALRKVEEERFLANHKKSSEAFADSQKVMHEGVPMSWMAKWPGAHPVFVKEAKGAKFTDIDGNATINEVSRYHFASLSYEMHIDDDALNAAYNLVKK